MIAPAMQAALGLERAVRAGTIYALNLRGGQTDSDGTAIRSEWVRANWRNRDGAAVGYLTGMPVSAALPK